MSTISLEECESLDAPSSSCQCYANLCPLLYNGTAEREACFMQPCFISKRALEEPALIQITILYVLIFIIGIVGNLITCIVIRRHPLLQTHSSSYLLNLAMSDLVTLCVGLPFEVVMNWNQYPWPFPDFVCNLKGLVAETTSSVSILTILLFCIERYIAVNHPFVFVKLKPIRRQVCPILVVTWLVSIVCAIPFGYYHRADYILKSWPGTEDGQPFLFHFSAIVFFLLPLSVIFILYMLIAFHVITRRKRLRLTRADSTEEAHFRVTIILSSIVCAFFVCYLPYQAQRVMFFYLDPDSSLSQLNQYIYFISGLLFYLATIVNPILYNLVSSRFRKASKEVLLLICIGRREGSLSSLRKTNNTMKCAVKYTIASKHSQRCLVKHLSDSTII
ncbi:hypothetical protein WR25_11722 [Diploscapter pachys]|uniref:G-protein coupled receptors family 1 profile domain-containing protein n=1 Tax=Diploscapter pachys TaxID=2018661 RepID=A0A2A2KPN2_9BILA|nr:hypothetical protein WR25_11722 [Diploscapter pachys]